MKSLLLSLTIFLSFFFSTFNYSYSSSDTLKYFTGEVFVVSAPQSGNVRFSDKRIQLSKIENRDYFSASELLNAVNAGITFKNSRNETVVSMRGFDRKQVAFFFDGVPLNAPNDGFTDIDIIPSSALALVSISKASTSNTYGVNTMGGAVNFISDEIAEPLKLDVKLMHGTTSYAEMLAGGSMNKFYWLLSADYSTSDGFSPADYKSDINISEKSSEKRLNSEFEKHSYFLKTGYNFSNSSSLGVSYLKSDGSRNVPINVYSNRKRFWQFTDISNEIASLSFNSNLTEKFSIRTNAFYSSMYNKLRAFDDSTYSTQTARSSFNSVFDDYSAGVSINGSYFISNDLTSNLYTSYKKDNHSSQSNTGAEFKDYSSSYFSVGLDNRYSFNKTAFYFSAAYDLLTPLSADTITSAGNLRENADAINFSIGSEYSEDFGILYASFSGKTRFPTLKELYSEFMGRNEPNPTLKPERALTGEIGIRAVNLLGIDLSASIFVSQLKDLIQYFPSSDGLRKFDNVGEAIFTGTEITLSRNFGRLGFNADYKYLMTKEVGSDTTKFEDKPAHLVALNIFAQLPLNIRIDMFNNFVSGRYSASFDTAELQELDGFYLLNLRAEMKIFGDLFIFANANNLTNSYYETVHGFPAEGRNFSLGIRYSYK